jgi:bla regulator protein BlaR1
MSELFVSALVRACWQGTLAAALVFAVFRLFPKLPARARAWAYWLVCLKFALAPLLPFAFALPLLEAAPVSVHLFAPALAPISGQPIAPLAASTALEVPWFLIVCAVWLVGAAIAIERLVVQHREVRALATETAPVAERHALAALERLSRRVGLSRPPALLASERVTSPLVTGLFRPRIVVPRSALSALSGESLEMALAHELAHLRNGDLWLAWVPALAQVLLWFFPVVRLCTREFAQAREESCDAEAVALTGVSPSDYGELLLAYGVSAQPIAASAACAASPRFHHLRRRLQMLQHFSSHRLGRGWLVAGAAFTLLLMPFRVVAKGDDAPPPPPPPPASAPVPPVPPTAGVVAPAIPSAPTAPGVVAPPIPPLPPAPGVEVAYGYNDGEDHGFQYALIHGRNTTMSGSMDDLSRAQDYKSKFGDHYLWVRMNGHEYVLNDEKALSSLKPIMEQQQKLGEQQGKLGEQQEKLGEQQGKLGEQQGALGEQIGRLSRQEARLELDREDAPKEQRDSLREQVTKVREQSLKIQEQMEKLSDQQSELGRQQGELGRQQGELGRQQGQLGREMSQKMRELVQREISAGHATQVR